MVFTCSFKPSTKFARPSNALLKPDETDSNIPISLADFLILLMNSPNFEAVSKIVGPIPLNIPPKGLIPFITETTPSLTNAKISNNPLNVVLIFPAVSSLILNFSVRSLNLLDNSTNLSPVIAGNTSLQASPIEPNTFPSP